MNHVFFFMEMELTMNSLGMQAIKRETTDLASSWIDVYTVNGEICSSLTP